MKRFLFPISALLLAVLSAVSFGSSSVSAVSIFDDTISTTTTLKLDNLQDNGESRDYATDWYSETLAAFQARCDRRGGAWCDYLQEFKNVLNVEGNDWAVVTTPDTHFFYVIYTIVPDSGLTTWTSDQAGNTYFNLTGINPTASVRHLNVYYNPAAGADSSSNGTYLAGFPSSDGLSVDSGSPIFLSTFPVTYPDGYSGEMIPDTYAPAVPTDPLIDWWLTDKLVFSARYLNNLGIANTAWTWKIFPADDNFQITGDPIHTSDEIQGINMFTYTFAEKGKYIARASFRIPAPGLPPPPEVRTTLDIQLNVDGYYQRGGTNHCQDGICNVPVIECAIQPTYLDRLNCKVEQMFNFGLLNPSLIAFRSLLSSFVVPTSPNCSIPLPNVQITPGRVFPLSSYSSIVCTRAEQLRNKFPIAPIVVNFALAMLLLWMIVRIINRILDNNKHDLIEGV